MTKIEKQMIGLMGVFILAIVFLVGYISHEVEQAGGFKQIVIETGKEIKDIAKEIEKD